MDPIPLTQIAAGGHQAPAGAHLIIVGVVIVGVVVAFVASRRHRSPADEPRDHTDRERSER